jgi:hypothetical protein
MIRRGVHDRIEIREFDSFPEVGEELAGFIPVIRVHLVLGGLRPPPVHIANRDNPDVRRVEKRTQV